MENYSFYFTDKETEYPRKGICSCSWPDPNSGLMSISLWSQNLCSQLFLHSGCISVQSLAFTIATPPSPVQLLAWRGLRGCDAIRWFVKRCRNTPLFCHHEPSWQLILVFPWCFSCSFYTIIQFKFWMKTQVIEGIHWWKNYIDWNLQITEPIIN